MLGSGRRPAQLRGVAGAVPNVGAIPGIGSVTSGIGSVTTGIGASGLGGVASGLGGSGFGTGIGSNSAPAITIPFPNQVAPSDALGAYNARGTPSPGPADSSLLNSVTNSLAGPVTRTGSRAANAVLKPSGGPLGQPGSTSRPGQTADSRGSGVPPPGERRYVPREVVVGLASDLSPQALDELTRRHRLTPVEAQQVALAGMTYHRWRIGDGRSVSEVIRALEADGTVRTAQPNYRFSLAQSPQAAGSGQRGEGLQYAPGRLHLAEAHRYATGENVLVAVIDSGIDTSHPEIADAVADHLDVIAPGGPPHAHGTGMAGAIVARSRLTGIAPGARLLAIRAFSGDQDRAESTTLNILRGLDWAIARGARVVNMSFAGPFDPNIARALAAARQKGAVLVAAAGNAGPKSPPLYPAADKNVIAVTATNSQNQLLPAANRGRHIALAAPGVDILVPSPGQGYQLSTGTSVAAAEVSGIVALLIELQPSLTPEDVRRVLQSTALDLGPKGFDDQYGAGLADAQRAVLSLYPGGAGIAQHPATLFTERWPDALSLRPSQE